MSKSAPKYNIGDRVYVRSSAITGWLDSYEVTQVRQGPDGRWWYRFSVPEKAPANTTVGDQNNLKSSVNWEVGEHDLIDQHEAIDLAITYYRNRLNSLEIQRSIQQEPVLISALPSGTHFIANNIRYILLGTVQSIIDAGIIVDVESETDLAKYIVLDLNTGAVATQINGRDIDGSEEVFPYRSRSN